MPKVLVSPIRAGTEQRDRTSNDEYGKSGPSKIELRVEEIAQLFETLDPLPFRKRDLDRDAEDYIVSWARELPRDHGFRMVIHAPAAETRSSHAGQLESALHQYFGHRADAVARDPNELFRVGRMSLAIGIVVLATCVVLARLAGTAILVGSWRRA